MDRQDYGDQKATTRTVQWEQLLRVSVRRIRLSDGHRQQPSAAIKVRHLVCPLVGGTYLSRVVSYGLRTI